MSNVIESQTKSPVSHIHGMLSQLGDAVDRLQKLALIADPSTPGMDDFLVLYIHLCEDLLHRHEVLRVALVQDVLPFAADMRRARLS
jgi:hypothetical protein